jgi:hypothetical protein
MRASKVASVGSVEIQTPGMLASLQQRHAFHILTKDDSGAPNG